MPSGEARYGQTDVGATAVLLVSQRIRRESLTVQNNHASQTLHLGTDASVTTTTGLKVAAGGSFTFSGYQGNIYAIASGAATAANYFESY